VTEIPKTMRTLPRDGRGYPVPYIVMVDRHGQAHFSINDIRRVHDVIRKRLCSICGKKLLPQVWFVGGTRCFISTRGAFLDPPVHHECGTYALQVCPFLAAPNYAKRIGHGRLKAGDVPGMMALVDVAFSGPMRPERFGLGATRAFHVVPGHHPGHVIFVPETWDYVEFWRNGEPIEAPDRATLLELERIE
jgi:hypothetical protein